MCCQSWTSICYRPCSIYHEAPVSGVHTVVYVRLVSGCVVWDGRRISGKRGQGSAGIAKGNLIGARDMQIHADARKVWNRAFTAASVKKYEPIVIRRIAELVDELRARCGSQGSRAANVDIASWVNHFS